MNTNVLSSWRPVFDTRYGRYAIISLAVTVLQKNVPLTSKVGLIRVEGPIMDSKQVVDEIKEYAKDASIKVIVLRIDSPSPYTPTYIGNGYLGVATSPLGTGPNWSYMAGLYDHAEGDIPHIAGLPAWNEVNFFDGAAWLNNVSADSHSLHRYHQSLNMYDGSLRTQYEWERDGHITSLSVEMFVSRTNPNLAAVKFQVTTHDPGPVKVALSLRGWPAPKRYALARLEKLDPSVTQQEVWYPGYMVVDDCAAEAGPGDGLLRITSHPEGAQDIGVSEVAALEWPAVQPCRRTSRRPPSESRAILPPGAARPAPCLCGRPRYERGG